MAAADTIFAAGTAIGRAGITVIRLSGPQAGPAVTALTGRPPPPPRRAVLTRIHDPRDGAPLDTGLVLWFPAPRSVTGEDVAELHVHGGRAVFRAMAAALASRPGVRPAEAGEFTRRAFANGKLDLTQAEAIADLVAAETEAQRRQALRQQDGALHRLYEGWRGRLLRALAHLEADLDFPDEDLPSALADRTRPGLMELREEIIRHLSDDRRGERVRDGIEIAILGAPNVGKSSLLNRLVRREAAIVSAQAGTTRDVVEVQLDLGGYPVVLADTAGLRAATDALEDEGIRRAWQRAERADLRLVMVEAGDDTAEGALGDLAGPDSLLVVNKIDRAGGTGRAAAAPGFAGVAAVSALTGAGIEDLLRRLEAWVGDRFGASGAAVPTRARHRAALEECARALERAFGEEVPELAAEEVRLAVGALGRITGRVDVEELLEVVFRDFCIGK